jgi:bifunctional DNase/RNase
MLLAIGCSGSQPLVPAPVAKPPPPPDPGEPVGLPKGYVEVRAERVVPFGETDALLLVDETDNLVLPVYIGGTEGSSIQGRLLGVPPIRPLTHDLLDHVLVQLHAKLVQVQVDTLRRDDAGGVFIGSIFVRSNGTVLKLDARPSDAIALAIGDHVPIYVARAVLDEAAYPWDAVRRQLQATGSST